MIPSSCIAWLITARLWARNRAGKPLGQPQLSVQPRVLRSDKVGIPEPLSKHPAHDLPHLVDGVQRPVVVPTLKLPDVAVKVLRAELVIDTLVSPLEHRPERLHAVRVGQFR